ncbi:MAG: ThuA domain-containing protein [Lentisphaeraceae bacterium]|nr:ThuA domain-containing protein [Lentisphaeraceae bacterium]
MKFSISLLMTLLFAVSSFAQEMHKKYVKVTPEIQEKIKKALPKEYQKPAQTRKVVVYSKSSGFVHNSTSVGIETLKQMAAATGAFEVTFNDDASAYTADYLKQFDAIIVNNATQIQKAFKEENRKALMDFIKGGKSFIGIHSASDGGYKPWIEYSEMIGGHFDGHPWNAGGKWAMEVTDTSHPINAPFKEKLFIFQDEIYKQSGTYKKESMHQLVKIDPKNDPLKKKVKHDRDYPISWMKSHGKGKVFYTCFGHRAETYYEPMILDHMLRGFQWALGDLKGEMVLGK